RPRSLPSFPTRRSSDLLGLLWAVRVTPANVQDKTGLRWLVEDWGPFLRRLRVLWADGAYLSESLAAWLQARFGWQLVVAHPPIRSEEHTSELQSPCNLV